MKDALKADRAKIQVGRISHLRADGAFPPAPAPFHQRVDGRHVPALPRHGLYPFGGNHRHPDHPHAGEGSGQHHTTLRVTTHPEAALFLLNEKRAQLQALEQRYNVTVVIQMDASMITGNFRLIKVTAEGREILHEDNKQPKTGRGSRAKRGRRGGRERDGASFSEGTTDEPSAGESREGDDDIISGEPGDNVEFAPRQPREARTPREPRGERGDRPRRERGGRNRRGGRGDRPDRTPRDPEQIAAAVAGGEAAPQTDAAPEFNADGTPRERSDRNRRRGRRGGRNRNNGERGERRPRSDRPEGESAAGLEAEARNAYSNEAPATYVTSPPSSGVTDALRSYSSRHDAADAPATAYQSPARWNRPSPLS